MKYLPQVTKASYAGNYTVVTTFDDGTVKRVDVSQWFRGPVFLPLKNKRFFRQFFLEGGTLAWPNGVDIAPEALYDSDEVKERDNKRVERVRARKARSNRSR